MEIGIDSFAAATLTENQRMPVNSSQAISELIERIVQADKYGHDIFGMGEHHQHYCLHKTTEPIKAFAHICVTFIKKIPALAG